MVTTIQPILLTIIIAIIFTIIFTIFLFILFAFISFFKAKPILLIILKAIL